MFCYFARLELAAVGKYLILLWCVEIGKLSLTFTVSLISNLKFCKLEIFQSFNFKLINCSREIFHLTKEMTI